MTRDDIIRMAQEARLAFTSEEFPDIWQTYMNPGRGEIERFAALVAAAEREKMLSEGWRQCAQGQRTSQHCALVEQERARACRIVIGLCISDNNAREINERIRDGRDS